MIKALLFDIGGVVLPHAEPHVLHDQKWEDLLNLGAGEIRRRIWNHENSSLAVMGKVSFKEFMIWIGQELGLTDDQLTDWNEDQWSLVRYDQDLANWLQSLRSRFKVALVSNAWSDAREELSDRYGLAELADLMVFSAEERVAKPQPGIYEVTLERLGVTAPESIFVDDRQENVDAAISLRMAGIVCTSPEQMMRDANSVLGSNTLDLVGRILEVLHEEGLNAWTAGGWGEELRELRPPGYHSDIDIFVEALDFEGVENVLAKTPWWIELARKRFSHKRAWFSHGIMVECILVKPDLTTSMFDERLIVKWPEDIFGETPSRIRGVPVISDQALALCRDRYPEMEQARRDWQGEASELRMPPL